MTTRRKFCVVYVDNALNYERYGAYHILRLESMLPHFHRTLHARLLSPTPPSTPPQCEPLDHSEAQSCLVIAAFNSLRYSQTIEGGC